jgi:hypothetical protein
VVENGGGWLKIVVSGDLVVVENGQQVVEMGG